jgi:hypothetical protein
VNISFKHQFAGIKYQAARHGRLARVVTTKPSSASVPSENHSALVVGSSRLFGGCQEHDPEKCVAVFCRDKRGAFARRPCSIKNLEHDGDST